MTADTSPPDLHVVTGAFGFTGRHVARMLLERGHRVRTLTGDPTRPNPFGDRVEAKPFDFDDPIALTSHLRGAKVLYNTYWVRFVHRGISYDQAVANTRALFAAAQEAGVARVVHISIANPSLDSPLPYYRGKAELEQALLESGLSYAILRPTVLFGTGDVLLNNIAWLLRHLPIFGTFGDGRYGIQPVFVEDLAAEMVAQGERRDAVVMDAVGPEAYAYRDLVKLLRTHLGRRTPLLPIPPILGLAAGAVLSRLVRDVLITRDEIQGLMSNLLISHAPPTCPTKLSDWLDAHADELGRKYASEVGRHYRAAR